MLIFINNLKNSFLDTVDQFDKSMLYLTPNLFKVKISQCQPWQTWLIAELSSKLDYKSLVRHVTWRF